MDFDEKFLEIAIKESKFNSLNNYKNGGPFGAVVVKNGEIIAKAHNTVIETTDATAHAEVNAIRLASKKLNTYDLKDCCIYSSCEPCPMCLSAIIWSNIKEVYFANTKEDAADIGFRDDMIYNYLNKKDNDTINLHHIKNQKAKEIFDDFKKIENKNIY